MPSVRTTHTRRDEVLSGGGDGDRSPVSAPPVSLVTLTSPSLSLCVPCNLSLPMDPIDSFLGYNLFFSFWMVVSFLIHSQSFHGEFVAFTLSLGMASSFYVSISSLLLVWIQSLLEEERSLGRLQDGRSPPTPSVAFFCRWDGFYLIRTIHSFCFYTTSHA